MSQSEKKKGNLTYRGERLRLSGLLCKNHASMKRVE